MGQVGLSLLTHAALMAFNARAAAVPVDVHQLSGSFIVANHNKHGEKAVMYIVSASSDDGVLGFVPSGAADFGFGASGLGALGFMSPGHALAMQSSSSGDFETLASEQLLDDIKVRQCV